MSSVPELDRVSVPSNSDPLMTPAEVADALRIDTVSLARWARDGRIASITLPNGHRRYRRSTVEGILTGSTGAA